MHESYKKWLEDGKPKIICACGCGGEIIIRKRPHSWYGIPKCIKGHFSKEHKNNIAIKHKGVKLSEEHKKHIGESGLEPPHKSYEEWLNIGKPKIYCQCGCNNEIIVKDAHRYKGIPKYIRGHSSRVNPPTRGKIPHNKNPYPPIFDLCKCGCCEIVYGGNEFIQGHHTRVMENPMKKPEIVALFMGDKNSSWRGGISFDPYCEKWTEKKREEIRNLYNRKCVICNTLEKDNITKNGKMKKLSVHHIDSDKEQGCNNKPWKLMPLCMHCHNSKKWS